MYNSVDSDVSIGRCSCLSQTLKDVILTRPRWDPQLPSLLPTIVCYADILGFRDMTERAIESGTEGEFLQRIKRSLATAYKRVRDTATLNGTETSLFDMKVFTDNIIVAYPLSNPTWDRGEPELGRLLILFAQVQAGLAADGFFLRGAITAGQHYQDQDIAYGKALLEAVDLNRPGKPPRLVIGNSIEPLISEQLSWYADWAPHYDLLFEDACDGRLFLNYLEAAFECFPDGPIDHHLLAKHRTRVRTGLRVYESHPRVWSKYAWIANYHDYVCQTFGNRFRVQGGEEADPEETAAGVDAHHVLSHLLRFEDQATVRSPMPLNEQRLKQRVDTSQATPGI